MMLFGKMSD